jgi:hypothetical protein
MVRLNTSPQIRLTYTTSSSGLYIQRIFAVCCLSLMKALVHIMMAPYSSVSARHYCMIQAACLLLICSCYPLTFFAVVIRPFYFSSYRGAD